MSALRTIPEVLTEIETLLASSGGVDRDAGTRIVQEYLDVVGPAIALLARCAGWAERGLQVEALSVARDFPGLIELGERLLEGGLSETVARTLRDLAPRGVSIPTVDPRWVDVLDRADGDVDRLERHLERMQAMAIGRAPLLDRVKVIRELIRQEPGSKIWQAELGRLEDFALAELRETMRAAEQRGDAHAVERCAGHILGSTWARPVPDELRDEARRVLESIRLRDAQARYVELVSQIRTAHEAADHEALDRLELEWVRIQQTTGAMPPSSLDQVVQPSFDWLQERREQRDKGRRFREECDRLDALLDSGGSEMDLSRQLSVVRAFDQELPPGLEQRVQHALDVIQSARQRRLALRIAAVIAVVTAVGAIVWWRIHRIDVRKQADEIAAQVDKMLEAHELEEAQSLVDRSTSLAQEAAVIAAASRVSERRPAWESDRDECRKLLDDLSEVRADPVTPGKRKELEDRAERLRDRLKQSEMRKLDEALAVMASRANEHMAKLQARFQEEWTKWQPDSRAVPSLDSIAPSDAWRITFLEELLEGCAAVLTTGRDISERYAELGEVSLAVFRAELARIDAISASATDRLKALDAFRVQFSSLVAAAGNPPEFLERYGNLVTDQAAVLNGLGLTNSFRDGRERSQISWELVQRWNEMVKALEGSPLTERRDPLTAEQVTAIRSFLQGSKGRGLHVRIAQAIDKVASRINAGAKPIGERLSGQLVESGIPDLKVMPLAKGGRLFRRIAEPDGPYNSGVLGTRDDVSSKDLDGVSPRPARDTSRPSSQCPTSARIQRLSAALKPLGLRDCRQRVLACIGEIVSDQSGSEGAEGAAFRLWVVVQLLEMWKDSLSIDSDNLPVDKEIARLLAELRQAAHSRGMDFDWGRPVLTPDDVLRASVADAAALASMRLLAELPSMRTADALRLDASVNQLRLIEPAGAIGRDPMQGKLATFGLVGQGPFSVGHAMDGGSLQEFADKAALESNFASGASGPVLVFTIKETP